MYKFIKSEEQYKKITTNYIDEIENKFNIKFPNILKEYYLNYNCAEEKECTFKVRGIDEDFVLDFIIPLKYGNCNLEKEYEWVLKNDYISNKYIPLAYDIDSNMYYWDSKNGKVYYISNENVENPILICNSVDEFFDILNRCCEETITISNLNESKNPTASLETNVHNNYDANKILKYNGKFIFKCNLILIVCIILSLFFMSTTDGLSAIIAVVFTVWLLVFTVIDIINRIISSIALKRYNLDEVKKEILDKKSRKIEGLDTYLTDNYIVSNSKTIKITKYSDIVWTYLARPMGTIYQQGTIGTAYRLSENPVIAHLKNGKRVTIALVKNSNQLNEIFTKITNKNKEVLVGETAENIKRYENINKNFKIKNKTATIMLIVLFLLIIVGFIYVNFIK